MCLYRLIQSCGVAMLLAAAAHAQTRSVCTAAVGESATNPTVTTPRSEGGDKTG